MANTVYGIDLGTTYSCISRVDRFGRPEVLNNLDNEPTTPSVVLFDSDDQVVVGKQAKRQARINPDNVASLVKRSMGDHEWRFSAQGKEWSAPAISAFILKALAGDVERQTGEPVTDVVITVPAYFGDEERKATKLAGEYAGMNVVDIINEPTAAAFAYGFASQGTEAETVLVYDLGGGTFDVTVIELSERKIKVITTDGDHELGGADWDSRLATHLSERFMEECPDAEDPLDDSYGAQDLISAAEEAKQNLTNRESTDVLVVHAGHRANITVTREELEQLTASLLTRTMQLTRAVTKAAEARDVTKIDRVLLVGGSSKMPAVAEKLRTDFGFDPQLADPDLAVAKGAAIYGQKKEIEQVVIDDLVAQGKLAEGQSLDEADTVDLDKVLGDAAESYGLPSDVVSDLVGTQVQNVCSRGFGLLIQGSDGTTTASFLTHRNDSLPLVITDTFYTVVDDQAEVQLDVFEQGGSEESPDPDDNSLLISGSITGIPSGHKKGAAVEITFAMGSDGTLDVTGRHVAMDEPLHLRVETGAALSPETIASEKGDVDLRKPSM
ncbi:MAG TPA: Hsp70 family protein [Iamia sp.]|nr:Hsp70 family protein [Iamia sp.]